MLVEIQESIYQQVRFQFACAYHHERELKAVISKCFTSAEHLTEETISDTLRQIDQKATKDKDKQTECMFRAVFVLMMSHYCQEQVAIDIYGLLEAYPDFNDLDEQDLATLLNFRNKLKVSLLIFSPFYDKDDLMAVVCGVCGVTDVFLLNRPEMAARFLQVFHQETSTPYVHSDENYATSRVACLLASVQQQWDEEDEKELASLAASTSFWHNHSLQMLIGRDIPSMEVPADMVGYTQMFPPHDLDWSTPSPERFSTGLLAPEQQNHTPPPQPAPGDFYTNYAAQLMRFAQQQTYAYVYQSGFLPRVENFTAPPHTSPTLQSGTLV